MHHLSSIMSIVILLSMMLWDYSRMVYDRASDNRILTDLSFPIDKLMMDTSWFANLRKGWSFEVFS